MVPRRFAVVAVGVGFACGDQHSPKIAICESQATSGLFVQDRYIVGQGAPYVADLSLPGRDAELAGNMAARRAMAWQVAARVLGQVPLAEPRVGAHVATGGIPAWHTWYDREDFTRIFKKLYSDLGGEQRAARMSFAPTTLRDGLAWNATELQGLASWPMERYLAYVDQAQTVPEAQGFGGISRVAYSPGALTHVLGSYAQMLACRGAEPPAYAEGAVRTGQAINNHERLALPTCELKILGPYQTAAEAKVAVTVKGDQDVDLMVRRGAPPTWSAYDCLADSADADEHCELEGGGPVYVGLFAAAAATADVDVAYREADLAQPTCLASEFPRDAVIIKADWRRAQFGEALPIYDTSGPRMSSRLASGADWGPGDGFANPDASSIYTVTLPNGNTFRLAGLHIMTKELDHWVWATLWWSNTPSTDFGADRPAAFAALPAVWQNYKLCVTTAFEERDPTPGAGLPPSLAAALDATSRGLHGPSWCSNPYIELGRGNANTNCIGCHQHGGTTLSSEAILEDHPHQGSTRVRNNFFTDYSWALRGGRGDDLTAAVKNEVDYWDAAR